MAWWDEAIGYEVYLRSFADGDGDGIGDFAGLTNKLEYLADLGIGAIWVTPFYPSPQADFGYDVSDYTGIDPVYGNRRAFDDFVSEAHRLGLRVVIDLVPNHSSSRHPFFRSAVDEGPGSTYWDYYVWREPAADGGPPNNWVSAFGGSAWTYVAAHRKYYMHLFLAEQPDLNWANPAVNREFHRILQFWLDRGVDGFRIDVAHALVEDPGFRDNPPASSSPAGAETGTWGALEHRYDIDQPGVTRVYDDWRSVVGPDVYLVGEVYLLEADRVSRYVTGTGLDQSFYFGLNKLEWDPGVFATKIREAAAAIPSGWAWVQGSHDEHRAVTRFGGGRIGLERAQALWVGLMGLPGTPFLYQGEELGLPDGEVTPADILDPLGKWSEPLGRDPCRTPMPWNTGRHNGFTSSTPWLSSAPRPDHETIAGQLPDPDSPLNRTRALIAARRRTAPSRKGPIVWLPSPAEVISYVRGGVAHLANLGDADAQVRLDGAWRAEYSTGAVSVGAGQVRLGPRSAVILVEDH